MLDRAACVDEQFIKRVSAADFPHPKSAASPSDAGMNKQTALDIFDSQIKSILIITKGIQNEFKQAIATLSGKSRMGGSV